MTRSRTPGDLRERMERVAAKPRQPPQSVSKRRSASSAETERTEVDMAIARQVDAASARHASGARARQPGATPARSSSAAPARQSPRRLPALPVREPGTRLETLLAWGMWELTMVPAQRWQWFMSTIRTGDTQAHNRKRGD
jgi:hypothetical protein